MVLYDRITRAETCRKTNLKNMVLSISSVKGGINMINSEVILIKEKRAEKIVEEKALIGKFLSRDSKAHKWVAIDNTTREAWTEEFSDRMSAINWLIT